MNTDDRLDELTRIKGIGPARERWFRQALGVRTFRDLASLSADAIEARLKTDGQIASRSVIESWLHQAGELAALLPAPTDSEAEQTSLPVETKKSLATFVIDFWEGKDEKPYTTASYQQNGGRDKTWEGFDCGDVCRWMLETARGVLPEIHPESARTQPVAEPPSGVSTMLSLAGASLHIAQLQIFQPPDTADPLRITHYDEPIKGLIRGGEPLALEVSLQLTGVDVLPAGQQHEYLTRFYAYDHATGRTIHLGDADTMSGRPAIARLLARLPSGQYRLYILAAIPATVVKPDYMEVPMLHVI